MHTYTPPSRLREALSRALNPDAWLMLHKYDPEWDQFVFTAIMLGMVRVTAQRPFVAWIGDEDLWVGNYPYSFGICRRRIGRPSYRTIRLLKKTIDYMEKQHARNG